MERLSFHSVFFCRQQMEIPVNWVWAYGELEPGEYRLIKDYTTSDRQFGQERSVISVEFIIQEQS